MRHHEILWEFMRQHDTLRDIMDEMGLYETGLNMRHCETIGDIMRPFERA